MVSPFQRRVSELIPDTGVFLAHVAPAPLEVYFRKHGQDEALYDRLTVVTGSPGSGKTTIARLFRFETLRHLCRHAEQAALSELFSEMIECRAIEDDFPRVAGTRLSMEINYRDIWDCPYPEATKHRLMQTLISARAVLGWAREFESAGIDASAITPIFRADAAGIDEVGGASLMGMRARAAEMEREVYRVVTALVAPPESAFTTELRESYQPLDLLRGFRVEQDGVARALRAMVMLDDMHALTAVQRDFAIRWMIRRDLDIARWILWRFDALRPDHVLNDRALSDDYGATAPEPGVQVPREITDIRLQQSADRRVVRTQFRKMAEQMGRRYLSQMPEFHNEGFRSLDEMLDDRLTDIGVTMLRRIEKQGETTLAKANLPAPAISHLTSETDAYLAKQGVTGEEASVIRNGMLSVLVARTVKRTPQTSMFEEELLDDEVDELVVKPKLPIELAARIQLANEFGLPYYYGATALYDAGSENAELFLQMAHPLVDLLRVKAIRRRRRILTAKEQDQALRQEAERAVARWNFPEASAVRRLAEAIAAECKAVTMRDSAPLSAGACAVGVPMDDFQRIAQTHPDFARVLQFGVAYNVFTLVPGQRAKKQAWCLIELAGPMLIRSGLTFHRGGFVPKLLSQVLAYVEERAP